jgi:hypothetical protein
MVEEEKDVDVEGCGRDGLDGGCDDEGEGGEGCTGDCTGDGTGDCTGVGTPVDGDDGVGVVGVVVDPPNSRHNPIIVSP